MEVSKYDGSSLVHNRNTATGASQQSKSSVPGRVDGVAHKAIGQSASAVGFWARCFSSLRSLFSTRIFSWFRSSPSVYSENITGYVEKANRYQAGLNTAQIQQICDFAAKKIGSNYKFFPKGTSGLSHSVGIDSDGTVDVFLGKADPEYNSNSSGASKRLQRMLALHSNGSVGQFAAPKAWGKQMNWTAEERRAHLGVMAREADLLKQFSSPYVMSPNKRTLDYVSSSKTRQVRFVQEMAECDASSLPNRCKSVAELLSVYRDASLGLAHLHSKEYVHGDMKSENIFVYRDDAGNLTGKVADFGCTVPAEHIKKVHDQDEPYYSGTPEYFSPELWALFNADEYKTFDSSLRAQGPSDDIYALGESIQRGLNALPSSVPRGDVQALKDLLKDVACPDPSGQGRPTAQEVADRLGDIIKQLEASGSQSL